MGISVQSAASSQCACIHLFTFIWTNLCIFRQKAAHFNKISAHFLANCRCPKQFRCPPFAAFPEKIEQCLIFGALHAHMLPSFHHFILLRNIFPSARKAHLGDIPACVHAPASYKARNKCTKHITFRFRNSRQFSLLLIK